MTLIIVLAALFGGLWLDRYFETRPMFTIGLMVASVPVTLVMMFWVVRTATSKITANQKSENKKIEEEAQSGENE
ncbi:MAG: AtpZ/AtpI family protein [Anaerolineales bacterium]|nr:MAG: AtpZ/AtpI family protein [Anaerolineales bacterium]